MFDQERLINAINTECKPYGNKENTYEQCCGVLSLEDIFTTDRVYISAVRASSGFMGKKDTRTFMDNAWINSYKLKNKVLAGKFKATYYREREINERGKNRIIKPPTFECKVVQKVICDYVVRPILQPKMIKTSYASIKGRGTKLMYENILNALNKRILQYGEDVYNYNIILCDFSNYFASIPVDILFEEIFARYIYDIRLLNLMRQFSPDEYGLSLGNELSQVPASYYPSLLDHWIDNRTTDAYFRFMDDTLMICKKEDTERYINAYKQLTQTMGLYIKDEKIRIYQYGKPFTFCKERFLWDKRREVYYRLMNPKTIANEKKKLKTFRNKIANNEMDRQEAENQFRSVYGMIQSHPNTYRSRKSLYSVYQRI